MPRFASNKELAAYRQQQSSRAKRDWTAENHEGAKRLAYDLRNNGADAVARKHFLQREVEEAGRDRALRNQLTAMAYDSIDGNRIQVSTGADQGMFKEREGLKERTRYTRLLENGEYQDFKIIEKYENGILVDERAIKL
jgi:hypothetical protein